MTLLEWSEEYSVGIRLIDNDHRGLFETIGGLQDAIEQQRGEVVVGNTLDALIRYVQEHFSREERLMEEYGYPDFANHKKTHRTFARQVFAMQKVFEADNELVDLDKLVEFLRGWLMHHILQSDMEYVPYLRDGSLTGMKDSSPADNLTEQEMETVEVSVPAGMGVVLEHCAAILCEGGDDAEALEEYVYPNSSITLDEAKVIADFISPQSKSA
jgi:hemerythrin